MTNIEMWWPSPDAFSDLTVTDVEEGFDLSAPDGTECAAWLSYWSQDEEHHKVFQDEFIRVLTNHANRTLNKHGEAETVPDEQSPDRVQTEENAAGPVS